MRNLLSLFSNPVVILDKNGMLLEANKKALEMMRTAKKWCNRNFLENGILTSGCKAALSEYLSKEFSLLDKKDYGTELSTLKIKQDPISFSAIRILYNDTPSALVSFKTADRRQHILTEMVKERTRDLKQNEEKLWTILNSSPDAIIVTDINGTITDCNQAALKIYGSTSKEEVVGRNIVELITEKDRKKALEDFNNAINEGPIKNREYSLLTSDRRETSVELFINVVRDTSGSASSFVVQIRDITNRKLMEEKLRQHSMHLEKLVSEKTRKLKEAERMAAIGELAAMVGHDLRNPLMAIAGATYHLKSEFGSDLDEKTMEMFEHIERSIDYSNKIINDLLDYSTNNQLDYSETTPNDLVLESLQLANVPANVAVINEVQNKPRVKVDPEKIKRAFVNIIRNSVDSMPNGGKLAIKGRKTKGYYVFSFSDTGTGIPEEIHQKIWRPLFTTKAKGMGLGLPICKRIIDAHNGLIYLKSKVGKGTTMVVKVPMEPREHISYEGICESY